MDTKFAVVLAVVVASIFPILAIHTWQAKTTEDPEEEMIELALYFLKASPTFQFDGIPESVNATGAILAKKPSTWIVEIYFESRHAGYGDRAGQILAQVITPHKMEMILKEGKVVNATIDGVWDDIRQKKIKEDEGQHTEEGAIETALRFLYEGPTFSFDGIQESVRVLTVERLEGPYTWNITIAFECRHAGYGDRSGHMLLQVITPHKIQVIVQEGEVASAVIDEKWDETGRGS